MRKVWILEKWQSVEDLQNSIESFENMIKLISESTAENKNEEISEIESIIKNLEQHIANGGRWLGYAGKSIYRQFCSDAQGVMRRNPEFKYRVVEAETREDTKYWVGYKNPKENEKVLKFLYATL